MSKPKSKQTGLQRYSGPDLSELLDQVVTELGSTVAISAVNRVRSGGVAGFFCREEFEVVVDVSSIVETQRRSDIQSGVSAAESADPTGQRAAELAAQLVAELAAKARVEPPPVQMPARPSAASAPVVDPVGVPSPAPGVDPVFEQAFDPAFEQALPHVLGDTDDPILPPLPAMGITPPPPMADVIAQESEPNSKPVGDGASEVFGGPRPHAASGSDAGFMALLDRRLDEAADAEPASVLGHSAQPTGEVDLTDAPALADEPVIPAPGIPLANEPAGELKMLTTAPGMSAEFWLRLQRAQQELATFMPVASSFVATIGPLSLTTPIIRRLRSQPEFSSAEVVVLTDRTEIVSEPHWKLVRSGNQLIELAQRRSDEPTLLLIDVPVETPNWVAPLQNRLRMAGVGLFRYAIPGNPSSEKLDEYRLASDVPYVLDLISRVSVEQLVDFIAQRHPVASVSGADITAELLVAMREQVGVGR